MLRPYLTGKDLAQGSQERLLIDLYGLTEHQVRDQYPTLFQRVFDKVRPMRLQNRDQQRRLNWWLFGRSNEAMRSAVAGLPRYIATIETSKHKPFVFVDGDVCPDHKLYAIATDDAHVLGVLSSRVHAAWALAAGGRIGYGNDPTWTNTTCFLPFPFPTCDEAQTQRIRGLAGQLDSHRKRQQAQHAGLTLTGMYNVLARLRSGEALTAKERVIHEQGLVSVLKQIHDDLDAAVLDAYGWPHDIDDACILARLVALNTERAEEEKSGLIRWLRPEFQNPAGAREAVQADLEMPDADDVPAPSAARPWPVALADQARAVREALAVLSGPSSAAQVTRTFEGARLNRVAELLATLVTLGQAREVGPNRFTA